MGSRAAWRRSAPSDEAHAAYDYGYSNRSPRLSQGTIPDSARSGVSRAPALACRVRVDRRWVPGDHDAAKILDGRFDAHVQFNQLQDAAASGQYDGIVIVPNDTVSIAGALGAAKSANIPVVTALFPIGQNLTQVEPQVPGIVATVASPPANGAKKQAELVAEYCAEKDPCRVEHARAAGVPIGWGSD